MQRDGRAIDRAPRGGPLDVAVVGVGCRFPGGVADLDALWRVLVDGRNLIGAVPPERPGADLLAAAGVGGFLPDVDLFDAQFFGVSPREAHEVDPQQRLMLELSWAAMEHSGVSRADWAGSRTGVYLGVLAMDYAVLHARTLGVEAVNEYYAAGKEFSFGAGRVAYTFGLHGPSMTITAACASSLLAVHLAARALVAGDCDAALAGGVNMMLGPDLSTYMRKIQAMSPRGQCRPFDAAADGVIRGEGGAVVVLKRYADAVADGDRIWAVVKGSAANHDGRSAGLTAPNAVAQEMLLRDALRDAEVEPAAVDYVEAHATGTPLGDPIELSALAAVFGPGRPADRPLLIGSHKANFGHLDSAAGILGLLKAMLVAREGVAPPQIGLSDPTPGIDWSTSGLTVPTTAVPLPSPPDGRLVGVNAFGLSGTNVHVVLAAPPTAEPATPVPAQRIADPVLVVSGPTPAALRQQAEEYAGLLRAAGPAEADDLLYSAAARRTHHAHRLAVVGETPAALAGALDERGEVQPGTATGEVTSDRPAFVVHVFSGQGSQYPGMGMDLAATPGVARDTLRECDELIRGIAGWSLLDELARRTGSKLADTGYAQPAIFAIQLALSRLWASWGVVPDAVVGHSMGEVTAACAAGALALDDAMRVILLRGEVLRGAAGTGRTYAVELPPDEVAPIVERHGPDVVVSVVNGPHSVVIGGPVPAVDHARAELVEIGARVQPIAGDYAFHCPAVRAHGDELERLLAGLAPGRPAVPMLSSVDPRADSPETGAAYWGRNVREPVRFWPAVDRLLSRRPAVFVEVGPHPVLIRPLEAAIAARGRPGAAVGSLTRTGPASASLARALARLHTAGVAVDWSAVQGGARRYVPLPPVKLTRERYWLPAGRRAAGPAPEQLRAEVRLFDREGRLVHTISGLQPATAPEPNGTPPKIVPPTPPPSPPRTPPPNGGSDRERVAAAVNAAAAEALGYERGRRLARGHGFFELGMDSLALAGFVERLRQELDIPLDASVGIEHPTIDALTDHILAVRPAAAPPPPAPAPARHPPVVENRPGIAEPIAIVGIGCRLPGADGPEGFWRMLSDGVDATCDIPADRWDAAALHAAGVTGATSPGTVVTRRGAFLDRVEEFDNAFFRISAREARAMDPQQRLFLEVAWEALEDAGLDLDRLRAARTGLFVGMNTTDYQQRLTRRAEDVDLYYGTGNSFSGTPGRLSYFLGVRGPSLAVDTACSSSLVAVHLAVQSLRAGESEVALAGGVNVMAAPTVHLAMSAAGALSPDGRCRTFDASADGYGRGEGAGVVVLKTLTRARADGDQIYAIVRGSAVNHNGSSGGLTVPSTAAQEELISSALDAAGLDPSDVDYLEAHGTGTRLGDAAELRAAARALGPRRPADRPLLVGSVKTNIGHLEAAAGVAGLIKTALALRYGVVPPHLHVSNPTDQVAWDRLPIRLTRSATPLPEAPGRLPVAGVSAFGFTGTNAHVVLGAAEAVAAASPPAPPDRGHLLLVSAASETALAAARDRLGALVAASAPADLVDICHAAATRRTHLEHRVAVVGGTREELAAALAADPPRHAGAVSAGPARLILVYGDRADVPWEALDRDEPAFRDALDALDAATARAARAALAGGGLVRGEPVAVAVAQVALAAMWADHGVEPDEVAGYGVGEIAAACAAGLLEPGPAILALGRGDEVTAAGDAHRQLWLASAGGPVGASAGPDRPVTRIGGTAPSTVLAAPIAGAGPGVLLAVDAGPGAAGVAGGAPDVLTDVPADLRRPHGVLDTLAALHVRGVALHWPALYGARPYRAVLPRYAWQRRRHWVEADPRESAPAAAPADALPDDVRDRCERRLHTVRWQAVEPPLGGTAGRWLVCPVTPEAAPAAERLGAALRAAGAGVRMREPGAGEGWDDDHAVLLVAAGAAGPSDVVTPILLAAQAPPAGGPLWLVTSGAVEPAESAGPPVPGQAAAWALGRVLAMEAAPVWGGQLDLDPAALAGTDPAGLDAAVAALTADRPVGAVVEDELCLRAGLWYAPRLSRSGRLPATAPGPIREPDHWYAVTDALEPASRPFVDALVRLGVRRLVAIGDGPAPDPVADARIAELAADGVQVRRVRLDHEDLAGQLGPDALGAPLGGVVLLAPAPEIRPLDDASAARAEAELRWAGTVRRLDEATADRGPSLFCVTGSAAATWGAAGLVERAAAEGAVDALAAERIAAGRSTQVIRFMPRSDSGELSRRDEMVMTDSGVRPMPADEVAEAFEAVLRAGLVGVTVGDVDEARYARVCRTRVDRAFLAGLDASGDGAGAAAAAVPPLAAEVLALPEALREERLLEFVLSSMAEVLGEGPDAEVGAEQGFFDLGMDSVMTLSLSGRLERGLGVELPATLTFEFPNASALTRHLLSLLAPTTVDSEDAPPVPDAPEAGDNIEELSEADLMDRLLAVLAEEG